LKKHSKVRRAKIDRIRSGGNPRVLDLFAGCGGLSLGFESAGFQIAGAVEIDPIAARTHAMNFSVHCDEAAQGAHGAPWDISRIEPADLAYKLRLGATEHAIDVIVGGPPCQAYARVGRAKLREIAEHPEAFLRDPRSNLYLRFLAYVEAFQPVAILMENVPDALNHGGHNIGEETSDALRILGYEARYTLLNSASYGVPQMRERMFLVAYANELSTVPVFPSPTHWVEFPRGYDGTRRVALQNIGPSLFSCDTFFVSAPAADRFLRPAVTAEEALVDLPVITDHLTGELKRGARRFTQLQPYRDIPELSEYAQRMRHWPGRESHEGVFDHVIRSVPRDYPIFRVMKPGDQYPEAHAAAEKILDRKLKQLERQGERLRPNSVAYQRLRASIVPPYDATKFPNKWRKMERDAPARTLMAHLGKDGYSHIHYDSAQARTISVREAARLQSFPDGFRFCGTMNPAFRQIGNAVPPLMALALADKLLTTLQGEEANDEAGHQATQRVRSYAV
jgi:DNA (cytosine-5)-methyltransferase 1